MKLLFATNPTLAVAIERGGKWIVPGGMEKIQISDLVYFAIARDELHDVLSLVGVAPQKRGRTVVAGASSIGLALAKRLESADRRVVLIEEDPVAARRAADELHHVLVIRGRATDQSLLEDEEIELASTFVSVSDDHESNLVSGLLARRLGAGRSIVLIDNPAMASMVGDIGIDAIISQRLLTIGLILQQIRGGGVRSGATLLGDAVEIMEVEAERGSRITSAPLKDLSLPRGVLVAALHRGEDLVMPKGSDQIAEGDRLVIAVMSDLVGKLTEFLEA
jgi:trk system potassium uptake protein TrkA